MSKVKVEILSPIKVGATIIRSGSPSIPAKLAEIYAATGSVRIPVGEEAAGGEGESSPPGPGAPPTTDDVAAAIVQLDPQNPDHFTQGGKPKVEAIDDELAKRGFTDVDVSAEVRDTVWATLQADSGQ